MSLGTFARGCWLGRVAVGGVLAGVLALSSLAARPQAARAQAASELSVRSSLALATLTTSDQLGYLHYDHQGLLGTAHLGYAVLPWLDARLGVTGGGFLSSSDPTGGLLAPVTGLLAHLTEVTVVPYVALDTGVAFTGTLARPFVQFGIGADFRLGAGFWLGPTLGHGRVIQLGGPGASSDAGYLWIGLGLAYRPERAPRIAHRRPGPLRAPEPSYTPPVDEPPAELPPMLIELIDRALPGNTTQTELLAPVLFAFDSDQLEPVGVAMLHQVSRLLTERTDIEQVAIAGYADRRGTAEYNRALAGRRAKRVMEWLVEHGIAAERLQVAAQGASDPVERGDRESAHEQNRRVVFRVLRTSARAP